MAELSAADRLKIEAQLSDAEDAYHLRMTGVQESSVSHGNSASNSSMSFAQVSTAEMLTYINRLRSRLGMDSYDQLRPFNPEIF